MTPAWEPLSYLRGRGEAILPLSRAQHNHPVLCRPQIARLLPPGPCCPPDPAPLARPAKIRILAQDDYPSDGHLTTLDVPPRLKPRSRTCPCHRLGHTCCPAPEEVDPLVTVSTWRRMLLRPFTPTHPGPANSRLHCHGFMPWRHVLAPHVPLYSDIETAGVATAKASLALTGTVPPPGGWR